MNGTRSLKDTAQLKLRRALSEFLPVHPSIYMYIYVFTFLPYHVSVYQWGYHQGPTLLSSQLLVDIWFVLQSEYRFFILQLGHPSCKCQQDSCQVAIYWTCLCDDLTGQTETSSVVLQAPLAWHSWRWKMSEHNRLLNFRIQWGESLMILLAVYTLLKKIRQTTAGRHKS